MADMFSSDPVVRVKEATIFQDHNAVLNTISFEIEKGEFAFLVGRTGSGKSSLLKTLYADLPLRLGEIQVAGHNIRDIKSNEVPLLRRKIGIIFQDFQLFPDRTVGENLNFVMRATGWKESAKMKGRLAEVLMKVGLGSVEKKMPHQLSGGEQQRVVIARALINEPAILVADEPTGNLDPDVATGILKLFQQINNSGTAVLMATHSYGLIRKFPARILKCDEGKMLDSKVDQFELRSEEEW
jgi:cell division transport system ATP-binding protein